MSHISLKTQRGKEVLQVIQGLCRHDRKFLAIFKLNSSKNSFLIGFGFFSLIPIKMVSGAWNGIGSACYSIREKQGWKEK